MGETKPIKPLKMDTLQQFCKREGLHLPQALEIMQAHVSSNATEQSEVSWAVKNAILYELRDAKADYDFYKNPNPTSIYGKLGAELKGLQYSRNCVMEIRDEAEGEETKSALLGIACNYNGLIRNITEFSKQLRPE